jgi:hypothetical protein
MPGSEGEQRLEGKAVRRRDDDSDDLIECPYCGEQIYEGSERCPHCEKYLSEEDAPSRKPLWIVVCGLLALGAALTWVLGR